MSPIDCLNLQLKLHIPGRKSNMTDDLTTAFLPYNILVETLGGFGKWASAWLTCDCTGWCGCNFQLGQFVVIHVIEKFFVVPNYVFLAYTKFRTSGSL